MPGVKGLILVVTLHIPVVKSSMLLHSCDISKNHMFTRKTFNDDHVSHFCWFYRVVIVIVMILLCYVNPVRYLILLLLLRLQSNILVLKKAHKQG